eukprot:TRINITY_DN10057_c0_g3_i2.p1 TRINITY_DN10057_c0_g3~~TRINITY_DN10057_c0_g3_i2.p1  ORF type:complete len:865 (-),score=328.92 TRINITY_DN10057_c0_g3_i2:560-3154(-)
MKKAPAASDGGQGGANVRVVCRVRPFNAKEQAMLETTRYDAKGNKLRESCTEFNDNDTTSIVVYTQVEKLDKSNTDPYEKHSFNFDYVFNLGTEQKKVYEVAGKPIVESVLEGFNGTILTYGQTSSGKTFTMQGDLDSEHYKGIIPRMVDTVFEKIAQASESMEFMVKASMLEIYNEKIRDLLDPSKNNLNVREEKQKGIYVDGLTEKPIGNENEVYDLMKLGNDNRAVGVTNMNAQSSRSHSIFYLLVTMSDTENCSCKTGKLYLVDLAGSEMISKTGAKGQTLEEAKGINKSLTMLGRVINALTDGKSQFIPYRDSKLTRILQEALGGNSKTCLIITASPSMYNAAETLSTCRFGMRAKSIKNNAKINKQLTVAELKVIVAKIEKELDIKGKRVFQLENLIMQLGGTIPPDDENLKDLMESESTASEKSQESSETSRAAPRAGGEFAATPKASAESSQDFSKFEVLSQASQDTTEEERRYEQITIMSDQVEQQKSKEILDDLENQKKEINQDMDTLFEQLKQERKILKAKELKIGELKQQLQDSKAVEEKAKKEKDALMRMIVDLKKKLRATEQQVKTLSLKPTVEETSMQTVENVMVTEETYAQTVSTAVPTEETESQTNDDLVPTEEAGSQAAALVAEHSTQVMVQVQENFMQTIESIVDAKEAKEIIRADEETQTTEEDKEAVEEIKIAIKLTDAESQTTTTAIRLEDENIQTIDKVIKTHEYSVQTAECKVVTEDTGVQTTVKVAQTDVAAIQTIDCGERRENDAQTEEKQVYEMEVQTAESYGANTRRYTDSEVKKIMEEVAINVKRRFDEEKKIMLGKLIKYKKNIAALEKENKAYKSQSKMIASLGGTVACLLHL